MAEIQKEVRIPVNAGEGRRAAIILADLYWQALQWNSGRISFSATPAPLISIIIVSRNAHTLLATTLATLTRHIGHGNPSFEVVIIDNASDADTHALFSRVDHATIIANPVNIGFGPACNMGASRANGQFLLFLNPDVDLLPGALQALLNGFDLIDNVGIVGARLIFPGGILQEAGAFFVNDASLTYPYLRGTDDASAPEALYARETSYVSGAVLMITKALFNTLGGFDPLFAPAYYEDTDLCVRCHQASFRVIYQPRAIAIHYENATTACRAEVDALIDAHRNLFLEKHRRWLFDLNANPTGFMKRDYNRYVMRVLYIDDQTPHIDLGAGFPRANTIINMMATHGYCVTVYPVYASDFKPHERYRDIHPTVEILSPLGRDGLSDIIRKRQDYYDVVWVSRPHNINLLCSVLLSEGIVPKSWIKSRLIFDTEALFTSRSAVAELNKGHSISSSALIASINDEMQFAAMADWVVCVSKAEQQMLRHIGLPNVEVLGHAMAIRRSNNGIDGRSGILFVGSLGHENTPNVDSIEWFLDHTWSRIQERIGSRVSLQIVGEIAESVQKRIQRAGVEILGRLSNIENVFARTRISIAPTRFAAGVPHKFHESVSHGVPMVVTRMLAAQIGWNEGEGFISAGWHDPGEFIDAVVSLYTDRDIWNRTRLAGLERVELDCNESSYWTTIRTLCEA